jgi:hypothetical protein
MIALTAVIAAVISMFAAVIASVGHCGSLLCRIVPPRRV